MDYSRRIAPLVHPVGLVAAGVVGATAWRLGMWGLLAGAVLVAAWLGIGHGWWLARPLPPAAATPTPDEDADTLAAGLWLDAVPTPMLTIEDAVVRLRNRAARRVFAQDDRLSAPPDALLDPHADTLRHEGRRWRIDRVTLPRGRAVVVLIDVEQEERAAETRVTAEMIEVLGHELLNGLAPIVSLAESGEAALARPATDPALLREIIGTIARRADALKTFAEAYRALARLPEPAPRVQPVAPLAHDLARLFASRWPGIALSVTVAAVPDWPIDRDQLGQALWALLQNAAEAALADRGIAATVTLALAAEGDTLAITVTDNGHGVPPDAATRIFRAFHTTKPDGTGVGLSLARRIAQGHGGTLVLEPGAQTRFRLALPRQG